MMLGEVREVTPVHIKDHVNHTHAQRDGTWKGLLVLPSVDGHFYEVASYYEHTSEEAVIPSYLRVRGWLCGWSTA